LEIKPTWSGGGVSTRQPTNLACRQSEPIRA